MSVSSKNTVTETSKITFDHIPEHSVSAKLTHKSNHHRYVMKIDGKKKNVKSKKLRVGEVFPLVQGVALSKVRVKEELEREWKRQG